MDICTYLPVTNSISTTCPITTAPRITVTKNCPVLPTVRGGLYTYTGSVSNAGNVTLINVYVTDNGPRTTRRSSVRLRCCRAWA